MAASICDCIPYHIYLPAADTCHLAYSRGPCEPNEIFTPPSTPKGYSKCVENKCAPGEGVWFEKDCYKINEPDSCKLSTKNPDLVMVVNPNTMKLYCSLGQISKVSGLPYIYQPGDNGILDPAALYIYKCPVKGTRRHYLGAC